jgi:hypothetical protein
LSLFACAGGGVGPVNWYVRPQAMDDAEVRQLVAQLGAAKVSEEEAIWLRLRTIGPRILPFFVEAFPIMKQWRGRTSIIFHSLRYARTHDEAFQLGIAALTDKSAVVRYRGCMLVACSLRTDAVPHLRELLKSEHPETVADAKAALDAIKHNNHNYFIDRNHSGRSFLHIAGYAA